MIAIPLESATSTTISKLYGNAPFFALLDEETGDFNVIENEESGNGSSVAQFLVDKQADATIFYHMGEGVYKVFEKANVAVYSVEKVFCTLEEIYRGSKSQTFKQLDSSNYKELLDPGTAKCTCGTCES